MRKIRRRHEKRQRHRIVAATANAPHCHAMRFKAVAMSSQLKDSQMSIRLPDALKEEMATYAALTGRSTHHVAMEALREYLDWRTPQIEDLRKAIAAADDGDFPSDEEVAAV